MHKLQISLEGVKFILAHAGFVINEYNLNHFKDIQLYLTQGAQVQTSLEVLKYIYVCELFQINKANVKHFKKCKVFRVLSTDFN